MLLTNCFHEQPLASVLVVRLGCMLRKAPEAVASCEAIDGGRKRAKKGKTVEKGKRAGKSDKRVADDHLLNATEE